MSYVAQHDEGVVGQPQQPASDKKIDEPVERKEYECRDLFWAILFYVHIFIVIVVGFYEFGKYKSEMLADSSSSISLNSEAWGMIIVIIIAAFLSAILYLVMLRSCTSCLVWTSLLAFPILLVIWSFVLFYLSAAGAGVIVLLLAMLTFLFIWCVRARIPLTISLIQIVLTIVKTYPGMMTAAVLTILAQVVWVLVWVIILISCYYASSGADGVIFALVLSFYWTCQVIKNSLHCTIAGVAGCWYWWSDEQLKVVSPNPTWSSFKRASTTSFGSIAFGSLLVAIIQTLKFIADQMIRNPCAKCIVDCICNCIKDLMEYFNYYAYIYVALYGHTFCDAGKLVWRLVQNNNVWKIIINDNLVGYVAVFAAVLGGLMTALIAGLVSYGAWSSQYWLIWALIGFFVGFAITIVAMTVIESAISTIYLCYIGLGAGHLQRTHPAEGNELERVMNEVRSRQRDSGCCGDDGGV